MISLSDICSSAIVEKDFETLEYLINICDQLHGGVKEIDGFVSNDLPSDEKYEEMKRVLKENVRVSLLNIGSEDISNLNKKYIRKPGQMSNNVNTLGIKRTRHEDPDSLLVVDGIQVQEEIENIENAILMKKYDGCSICCVFTRCGMLFKLEYARTRGVEKGNGRNITDATSKMKLMVDDFETSFNNFIHNHRYMQFLSKDFTKIGNINEPIETKIDTIDIQKVIVRGELVLKEKLLDRPNCSAVAGPLNGKFQTFKDKCEEFIWKPFEIINFTMRDNTKIIPCQKDVLSLLMEIGQYDPNDFIEVPLLTKDFDFLGLLKTWQHLTSIPLDGIVYCSSKFTYPSCSEESSKRVHYGKYKFKKNDVLTTKINGFTFDIGSTGKYTCICIVEQLIANGKRYERIRLPFRKIENELEKGSFGINSVIEVILSRDIMLCLSRTLFDISKNVIPFEFPKTCQYCSKELTLRRNKQDTVLECTNKKCKGILMKRLEKYLSEIGMKGISETTIFKYFENREFCFKDFYRDVINVPLKSNTRRTGNTTIEKGPKYNYDELLSKITNEKLLIIIQIATPSNLKNKMTEYDLRYGRLDIASIRRINDELIKEIF